ncbi:MAG: hypothetical protein AAGG01_19875, partial [Planctomycetota bacterium]
MGAELQRITDWIRKHRADITQAIETATRSGLVPGATSEDRIEGRLLSLFKSVPADSLPEKWPGLLGKPGGRGS